MITDDRLQSRIEATLYVLGAIVMLGLSVQNYRYGLYDLVYSASLLMTFFLRAGLYARFAPQGKYLKQVNIALLGIASLVIFTDALSNSAEVKYWLYPLTLLSFTTIDHERATKVSSVMGIVMFLLIWHHETFLGAISFAATYFLLISLASIYAQLHQKRSRTLVELEIHDPLTGVYNFRHLEDTLSKEVCRSDRTGNPLSLIALEIDYLPQIHDIHGSVATNDLLKQVSDTLKAMIRAGDSEYYDAGQSFYLLLPCTPPEGVLVIAERIRRTIEESSWPVVDSITVSLGCTSYLTASEGVNANTLINDANIALFEAQKNGHNRVCHHD